MRLRKIKVENFRLLKNFELETKDDLSLIIGKNNCGKTSVLVILNKMLNSSKIMWEDINLDKQQKLYKEIKKFVRNNDEPIEGLESIRLQLFIEYDDKDSYTNIQKFMMDLNPENNIIVLEFIVLIDENRILKLQSIIEDKKLNDFLSFSKFMKKNFSDFFILQKYSRRYDPDLKQVTKEKSEQLENRDIQKVIKITGIQADRAVSNNDKNHVLSNLTEQYYNIYKSDGGEKVEVFERLEKAIESADKELYGIYNGGKKEEKGIFSEIIEVIGKYGGQDGELQIAIESSISEKNLLTGNTGLCYMQGKNSSLPETYNGLGYLNLIGILFEIETKITELYSEPADINILYIEEPEAHTHPQLQYIFIRNIKEHIKKHKNFLLEEKNKNIQVILTSHSSHIVSECNFDDIIYLKRVKDTITAKAFNSLEEEYKGNMIEGFKFVKQYLTLNRSELFFADKAICIEGDTERILIPMMMRKIDLETKGKETPLLSQNISIIETGAHSHVFMPLFEFLGIKILIITDIDAAKEEEVTKKDETKTTTYSSCNPREATHTTNASIKYFFADEELSKQNKPFEILKSKKSEEKERKNIRIAYQISENEYQASSFEDAFIAINKKFIEEKKEGFKEFGALKSFENIGDFYEFATKKVAKKSAFASSILYCGGENGEEWKVPQYIKEGLEWLKKN